MLEPLATPTPPPPSPPEADDLDQLGERIAEIAAQINAATYQLLGLLAEFDRREGWGCGFSSCAHWLSWRTGLSLGPAREHIRVARALTDLPKLSTAMQQGEISYSKVRALTRVATPENEEELLIFANAGTASHVERLVRAWRRVDRIEEREQEALRHESRYLSLWTDEDGMVVVRGRLDPEAGAALIQAVEAGRDVLYDEAKERRASYPEEVPPAQRRADALGRVAEAALAGGLDKGTRGDRYQVVVHVDGPVLAEPDVPAGTQPRAAGQGGNVPAGTRRSRSTVARDVPAGTHQAGPGQGRDVPAGTHHCCSDSAPDVPAGTPGPPGNDAGIPLDHPISASEDVPAGTSQPSIAPRGQCAVENGGFLTAETAQRLACDASKVVMTHDGAGNTLDVGRRTRIIPPAIRRALAWRDRSCRFPGCNVTFCDAHHLRHWARGGETSLDNLILLCKKHHRYVHEEGYRIQHDAGALRFLRPNGRPIPDAPPPSALGDHPDRSLPATLEAAGVDLDRIPVYPEWDGSRLDLGLAVEGLRG